MGIEALSASVVVMRDAPNGVGSVGSNEVDFPCPCVLAGGDEGIA